MKVVLKLNILNPINAIEEVLILFVAVNTLYSGSKGKQKIKLIG